MRTRLRFLLPLIQVVIAAGLTAGNCLRKDSFADPAYKAVEWQFCAGLNGPATLLAAYPRELAYRLYSSRYPLNLIIEWAVYFSLVWLLWYAVAVEFAGKGKSILTPKTRIRRTADVIVIIFGAMVGIIGPLGTNRLGGNYARLMSIPYLVWALVIIGFYGYDLHSTSGTAQERRSP